MDLLGASAFKSDGEVKLEARPPTSLALRHSFRFFKSPISIIVTSFSPQPLRNFTALSEAPQKCFQSDRTWGCQMAGISPAWPVFYY